MPTKNNLQSLGSRADSIAADAIDERRGERRKRGAISKYQKMEQRRTKGCVPKEWPRGLTDIPFHFATSPEIRTGRDIEWGDRDNSKESREVGMNEGTGRGGKLPRSGKFDKTANSTGGRRELNASLKNASSRGWKTGDTLQTAG